MSDGNGLRDKMAAALSVCSPTSGSRPGKKRCREAADMAVALGNDQAWARRYLRSGGKKFMQHGMPLMSSGAVNCNGVTSTHRRRAPVWEWCGDGDAWVPYSKSCPRKDHGILASCAATIWTLPLLSLSPACMRLQSHIPAFPPFESLSLSLSLSLCHRHGRERAHRCFGSTWSCARLCRWSRGHHRPQGEAADASGQRAVAAHPHGAKRGDSATNIR